MYVPVQVPPTFSCLVDVNGSKIRSRPRGGSVPSSSMVEDHCEVLSVPEPPYTGRYRVLIRSPTSTSVSVYQVKCRIVKGPMGPRRFQESTVGSVEKFDLNHRVGSSYTRSETPSTGPVKEVRVAHQGSVHPDCFGDSGSSVRIQGEGLWSP